ncbi:MAG: hypothetical protein HYZ50_24285 [Deltaproteobacteria bacterium]|nr:hypothetical protein [Deltaproteobacteria bacterium]
MRLQGKHIVILVCLLQIVGCFAQHIPSPTSSPLLVRRQYAEVRRLMKPGDVIAFGGKGSYSTTIEKVTDGSVSHAGIVVQAATDTTGPLLIDATSADGVAEKNLDSYSSSYDGDVWWLPIRRPLSGNNLIEFQSFLRAQLGKAFDKKEAIGSVIDSKSSTAENSEGGSSEDFSKWFCSKIVAAALEVGKVLPSLNAAKVSPAELCQFAIYTGEYAQLKEAETKKITGYNTISPEGWGERGRR